MTAMQHAMTKMYKLNQRCLENCAKFRKEVLDCTIGTSFSMTFSIISTVLTFN